MTTKPSLYILSLGDVPRTMAGIGLEWLLDWNLDRRV